MQMWSTASNGQMLYMQDGIGRGHGQGNRRKVVGTRTLNTVSKGNRVPKGTRTLKDIN
jgi:hypothetical protein